MDEKIIAKQLRKMLGEASGAVMADEFKQMVETIFGLVKELKLRLEDAIQKGDTKTMEMCKAMMSDMNMTTKKVTDMVTKASKAHSDEMRKMMSDMRNEMEDMRGDIPEMPDIKDFSYLEGQIESLDKKIKSLNFAEQIANELEAAKQELKDYIEKNKKTEIVRPVFGGRQLRMESFSFTGNGVLTSFNLPKEPGAKGRAIWAYYNGQHLQLGTQFTVTKNVFATVGWTPETDTVIDGFIII